MRRPVCYFILGLLAVEALRYVVVWSVGVLTPRGAEPAWYGALSFALAAVVDTDRAA